MRLLLLMLFSLLAGCAVLPERVPSTDPEATWTLRQTLLAQIDTWTLRGRVALRSGDEGGQASLQWKRQAETQRIELAGPIGSGRVRLTQNRFGAELRDARDRVYRDSSLQRLLLRRVGWDLPFDDMNYWVLGLPAPGGITRSELDAWGRLATLEQAGWEVRFLDYTKQGQFELPSQLVVRRTGTTTPVEARLIIETWTFSDHPP